MGPPMKPGGESLPSRLGLWEENKSDLTRRCMAVSPTGSFGAQGLDRLPLQSLSFHADWTLEVLLVELKDLEIGIAT